MKKWVSLLLSSAIILSSSIIGVAHERKSLLFEAGKSGYTVNGMSGDINPAPEVKDGTLFVPINLITVINEDAKITWSSKEKITTVDFWEGWLVIQADFAHKKISYIKSGKTNETKYQPYLKNNKTMLPVELLAELLEMDFKWDASTQKAKLRDYHWMSYGGFSDDFEVVTFTEGGEDLSRITKGTWLVAVYKDDQPAELVVENMNGKELYIDTEGKDPYPEYLLELEKQFLAKGVEGMTPIKGHEKESKLIIELARRAVERKNNFRKEFALNFDANKPLKDGEYTGKFHGYYPSNEFEVKVTVKKGIIEKVAILKYSDDAYVKDEFADHDFLPKFVGKKTPHVDVVSGATFSSKGVMKAVEDALKKAQ